MDLKKQFESPGVEWRGKPLWSWNGKLEKDELLAQIDVLKDMGMGGFFMHSRTGLATEYLGDEWFELINTCADRAEELGLEAWIYDEDRWPSGLAAGLVSKNPEFRQKAILLEIDPVGEGENVIAEFTCDLDGVVCTDVEQAFEPAQSSHGGQTGKSAPRKVLRFSIVEQGKSGFYNGTTYVDTMNRDATEAYLKCTHEKYAEKCGDRLGKSIKGVFTDEPHRGALLDGFCMYMENGDHTVPYTQKLFAEFEKRFGYDLKEKLPELFLQVDGQSISPVIWHFTELLQQLFLENFAIPCREWCEAHNLVLCGHILHEDSLAAQTAMSGSMMRYYEEMTWPGVDVLGRDNQNYWIVKQCASAARQTGKTRMLSELYGCAGWELPFEGHKRIGDWQALLGINVRSHHLSWYNMRGESKRDYPAPILHQSPWYREYTHVEDYFARFGLMMAQGEPVCELLVINPVESVWAQVHLGWSDTLQVKDKNVEALEGRYQTLFTWLLESQVDFDYGDEEMLGRLGSVDGALLHVGQAKYKTVLVAGMDTIRSSTLKLLEQFVEAGGKVIVAGEYPTHVDAVEDSGFKFPVSGFKQIAFSEDAVLSCVPSPLATVAADDIFGQLRRTDDGGLIFAALNVNRDERRESATVRIKTDLPIAQWNCETGEQVLVDAESSNGWKSFTTDFPKGGQKLYIANEKSSACSRPQKYEVGVVSAISGSFDYSLSEPNICVLDAAEYRFDEGNWQPESDVLKIDRQLREMHGIEMRGGEMCQPWFTAQQALKELADVELRYAFEVETMPEWVDLVIEDPENFTVEINGQSLGLSDFERWIDIAFHRYRLPAELLRVGENEIVLKTRYKEDSNLEAVYLLGQFGVRLDGSVRKLVPLPEQLEVGDICPQGLPFYSAAITYHVPLPGDAGRLRLPEVGGACAEVNGQVLGWDPYEADISGSEGLIDVKVVLTRRNTFGPLHDTVKDRPWNGPVHWMTVGDEWSDECIFEPAGLLAAPEVF